MAAQGHLAAVHLDANTARVKFGAALECVLDGGLDLRRGHMRFDHYQVAHPDHAGQVTDDVLGSPLLVLPLDSPSSVTQPLLTTTLILSEGIEMLDLRAFTQATAIS